MPETPENKAKAVGLACPQCCVDDWRILRTERKPGAISRRRVCQNCGFRGTTTEKFVNQPTAKTDQTATRSGHVLLSIAQILESSGYLMKPDSQSDLG